MVTNLLSPDYIFESSWEVCNKVGGIYTFLSTRAKTLQGYLKDKVIFLGPDFPNANNVYFIEDKSMFSEWKTKAAADGLSVRIGRYFCFSLAVPSRQPGHSIFLGMRSQLSTAVLPPEGLLLPPALASSVAILCFPCRGAQ